MVRYSSGQVWRTFTILAALFFGLVALGVSYRALTRGTELRSKAAESLVVFKQWEFNGVTKEGWSGKNIEAVKVNGGYLTGVLGKQSERALVNTAAKAKLDATGNKYIRISLTVVAPGKSGDSKKKGKPTPIPEPPPVFTIQYMSDGDKTWSPPVTLKQEPPQPSDPRSGSSIYSAPLLTTDPMTISQLRLNVPSSIKSGSTLKVDWIRLSGDNLRPPCQPRPSCLDTADRRCFLPEPSEGWCPITPTPTRTCISLPSCLNYDPPCTVTIPPPPPGSQYCPNPSPPSKCYYQQVECFQAPCDPILVCPTTTSAPLTPTPVINYVCTQEAKLCPDGQTWVSRTGLNCEFAPCP